MAIKLIVELLPKVVGWVLPAVGKLAKKETPEVGKRIAEQGAKLLLGGGALAGAVSTITLPEAPESWMLLLQQVTALVAAVTSLMGTVLILVGKTQTTDNPDTDRDL